GLGLSSDLVAFGVSGIADNASLLVPLTLEDIDLLLALGCHTIEDLLRDAFGQSELFDPDKPNIDAVIVCGRTLHGLEEFLFDLWEFELTFIGRNEIRKRMFGDDALFGIPNQRIQRGLGGSDGSSREAAEEQVRFSDGPTHIDLDDDIETIRR